MGESPKPRKMNSKGAKAQSKGLHNRAVPHSKYRILGLVGQGQFGRVFCASVRETSPKETVGQLVALKELSHQQAPTSEFLRELWFLITLQHPNIVTCRALEHTATGRYLVMDYCEGGTLRSLLKQNRPLRLLEGVQLVIGVLAGLDYTHRRGVVHCDIKPENILLTLGPKSWQPRLSDFGIARRLPEVGTSRGNQEISPDATIGSPAYMAPERFYGLYSPMSDIYAVGILLFEMLMGYRPFTGPPGKLMWAHLNQRLQLPEIIPAPLQEILKKSLEKLPARRYASASQMAQALRLAMYDPQLRQWGDRIIPWGPDAANGEQEEEKFSEPIQDSDLKSFRKLASSENFQPLITESLTVLLGSETSLYVATGQEVQVWCQLEKQVGVAKVHNRTLLPEVVQDLLPTAHGCYAIAGGNIYWLSHEPGNLARPWWTIGASAVAEKVEEPTNQAKSEVETAPIATSTWEDTYKAAIDPKNSWLAVAKAGELRFYSLAGESSQSNGQPLSLARSLRLPETKLPELMFLDQRHLLTIWSGDKEQPETTFRVYTRRGTLIGEVRLSVVIAHLVAGREPYTLFGVLQGVKSAVVLIHLRPLKVKRIPLESTPTCTCSASWGYAMADALGQIVVLDREGCQAGSFSGPTAPTAIAPWGQTGIAIATQTANHSLLHFVDIETGR